ncbi:hypothetical protein D3C75_768650 [compost metagenome]
MERSVKNNSLRNTRHIDFSCCNPHYCSRVVQRSKVEQLTDLRFSIAAHQGRFLEIFAPVHYTVAHSINFFNRADYPVYTVSQTGEHFTDSSVVLKNFADFGYFLFTGRLVGQNGGIHPDTFNQAFSQNGLIRHIIQLVFQRGTAGVNY